MSDNDYDDNYHHFESQAIADAFFDEVCFILCVFHKYIYNQVIYLYPNV